MNPNSGIKIGLGGSHLDRNPHTLNHFPGPIRRHVHPNHPIGILIHNNLEQGIRFTPGEGMLHGPELRFVHVNVCKFGGGILFGIPHRPNLGVGKHGGSNILVIHFAILTSKEIIGETVSFHECHGGQRDPIGDIPHRVDIIDIGLGIIVHGDEGIFRLDSRRFQAQVFDLAFASRGVHHRVAFHLVPIPGNNGKSPIRILHNFLRVGVELNINLGIAFHLLLQMSPHIHIKPS
mmetsp:Transcript_26509/g.32505  ORF Transcript_26509/g.32505 Transcript_26509/m.32505 type:complete len:234 (+) Transcript_26509:254-955(+)